MNLVVNSQTKEDFEKEKKTIEYFSNLFLNKFKQRNWKLKVWLKNHRKAKALPKYTCGLSLVRPKKKDIYIEKESSILSRAIRDSTSTLARQLGGS